MWPVWRSIRGDFKRARVSQSVCREEAKWEVDGVQVARYFVSRTLFRGVSVSKQAEAERRAGGTKLTLEMSH